MRDIEVCNPTRYVRKLETKEKAEGCQSISHQQPADRMISGNEPADEPKPNRHEDEKTTDIDALRAELTSLDIADQAKQDTRNQDQILNDPAITQSL